MSNRLENDWLQRQVRISAEHLLAMDPMLLSPVGRDLLPMAVEIVAQARRAEFRIVE